MKSIETQLGELRESIASNPKFKGVMADLMQLASGLSTEQKLSATKKYAADRNITESRIVRNNGRGIITESAVPTERIARYAKEARVSLREAAIFVTGIDVYKFGEPGSKTSELAEAWRQYCHVLNESEIATLVSRGKMPPKN